MEGDGAKSCWKRQKKQRRVEEYQNSVPSQKQKQRQRPKRKQKNKQLLARLKGSSGLVERKERASAM